ncbi:TetR/AcrR family transcriptional regulator [Marisediminicola antarctica]|uniref:TetR/AcrR family transcriptional regulator n=1 Tax=Marisediminicola antarctica TaxID=674079 RepID=UPI001379CDD1|nr:TetR/AcrR family transcriptional regulator [Marisediminicola antarctica]
MTNARGRPHASSCEMLQEAAFDLFLENGYAGTTVAQITQRAGVSRATFFNYFSAKSDVFWIDLDDVLARLPDALAATDARAPVMQAMCSAIVAASTALGPAKVPWALTHLTLVGDIGELQSSAMSRLASQARVLSEFITTRIGGDAESALIARSASFGAIGAVIAAAQTWADASTKRGELGPYLSAALAPLCHGVQAAIDAMPPGEL